MRTQQFRGACILAIVRNGWILLSIPIKRALLARATSCAGRNRAGGSASPRRGRGNEGGRGPGVRERAEFFRGKTMIYVVCTSPGGGYDTYGRLVARYLEKSISRSPTSW
jgi:hypothetical protein